MPRISMTVLRLFHSFRLASAAGVGRLVSSLPVTPNEFPDLQAVEKRLLDFQAYYETVARPFEWKFTRADLENLLAKLARQEQQKAVA